MIHPGVYRGTNVRRTLSFCICGHRKMSHEYDPYRSSHTHRQCEECPCHLFKYPGNQYGEKKHEKDYF